MIINKYPPTSPHSEQSENYVGVATFITPANGGETYRVSEDAFGNLVIELHGGGAIEIVRDNAGPVTISPRVA